MTTRLEGLIQDSSPTREERNVAETQTDPDLIDESVEHPLATDGDEVTQAADDSELAAAATDPVSEAAKKITWSRILGFGVAPLLAIVLASAAAVLWWHDTTVRDSDIAQAESTTSARDATVALLSYQPDKADAQLHAASALLTGNFKDSYAKLTNDVVIPGAKQKQIASVATVSAVASVSASPRHAVSLVFVDQTVTVGNGAPTATSSAIRVTLDKVENRWLISGFDPV